MNRASLLAVIVLVTLTIGLWLQHGEGARADRLPPAPSLPEALAPPAPSAVGPTAPGYALLGAAALLLLLWRRGMGQAPLSALLPGLVLLAHPAALVAVVDASGRLDLAGVAAVGLGAFLSTRERTATIAAGILLLFAGVLVAPSGALLAALAGLVLLERVPSMDKGALLLLVYGVARALGGPWLGTIWSGAARGPTIDVPGTEPLDAAIGVLCAVVPLRPVAAVPAAPVVWLAAVVLGLVLLGFLVAPERRFGGRWVATATLAAVGLAVLAVVGTGEALGATAALVPAVLLALWIGGVGDDVERSPARVAVASIAALALLSCLATVTIRAVAASPAPSWFVRAYDADPVAAESSPFARAALREFLAHAPSTEVEALVESRLSVRPSGSAGQAVVDRDLAVAAALHGANEPALQLLERAAAAAAPDGEAGAEAFIARLDVLLRLGEPTRALAILEPRLAMASDRERAELLVRAAGAHIVRAYRPGPGTAASEDRRDRELTRARERFAEAIDADRRCARAWLDRGRFRMVLGQGVDAVKDLEECARVRPDLPAPHLELAKLYFSRGQDVAGERELNAASRIAGRDDPEVRLVTAELQIARGDLIGAADVAAKLCADVHRLRGGGEELGQLYRRIAQLAEDRNDAGLAEELSRLALSYGTDVEAESTQRLARLLGNAQRYEELIVLLDEAERSGLPVPDITRARAAACKNAGFGAWLKGNTATAYARWVRVLDLSPSLDELGTVPTLLRNIFDEVPGLDGSPLTRHSKRAYEAGVAALADGDPARARNYLSVSAQLLPNNPFAHYHLGLALDRTGDRDAAQAAFQLAMRCAEAQGRDDVAARARALLDVE